MSVLGFDLRALQPGFKAHKDRGIGVYTKNLIEMRHLAPPELSIVPFHDPGYPPGETPMYGSAAYERTWLHPLRPFMKEYLWLHGAFAGAINTTARRARVDGVFFPSHLDIPVGLTVPYAATAHDMIHAALMERRPSLRRRVDVARQGRVLRGARLILADSNHTKQDVVRYARVEPDRIVVVSLGADPAFRPGAAADLGRFDLPGRFILHVGGIESRKNIDLLFDVFARLSAERPEYHLVMTGSIERDPLYRTFQQSLERRSLETHVRALGYVTREELAALYCRAEVFLYPSLYEGFGLPVLEAMACGAPVITSNRSSIPEVAGDAAILLDPADPEPFFEALTTLLDSPAERGRLREAGLAQASKFSRERCAEETYRALASL